MKRAWFCVALLVAGCTEHPIGDPAGSNNFDDPDDPGRSGQQTGAPDASGDASGRFCVMARDCPAAFVCAYPIADTCGAAGRCLPYTPTSSCTSTFACGCDGTPVAMCAPDGYAPQPISANQPCDGGAPVDAGTDAPVTIDSGDDASDDATTDQ